MNDLEIAVSVLAVVALPLVGVGPMLMRNLPPAVFGACVLSCAAIVFVLTGAPWATAFTACLGAALLLQRRRVLRRRARRLPESPAYGEDRSSMLR